MRLYLLGSTRYGLKTPRMLPNKDPAGELEVARTCFAMRQNTVQDLLLGFPIVAEAAAVLHHFSCECTLSFIMCTACNSMALGLLLTAVLLEDFCIGC